MYGGKKSNLRTLSREYDCLAKIGITGQTSKGDMSRLELTIKDKKTNKKDF